MKTQLIFQFKVTLLDVEPPVWRRVQVRANASLHRLATTIILAMGWSGGHLHQFHIAGKQYSMPIDEELDAEMEMIDERYTILEDLDRGELGSLRFEYDFGDGWMHDVDLEEVLEAKKADKHPKCLDGARCCPPDDCGGPRGYKDFLAAIKDPRHPEHESTKEWIGCKFNPEAFHLKRINSQLRNAKRVEDDWWG